MADRRIYVFIELDGNLHHVGQLWARSSREKEGASFQHAKSWLDFNERFALEPALELNTGVFHTEASN